MKQRLVLGSISLQTFGMVGGVGLSLFSNRNAIRLGVFRGPLSGESETVVLLCQLGTLVMMTGTTGNGCGVGGGTIPLKLETVGD